MDVVNEDASAHGLPPPSPTAQIEGGFAAVVNVDFFADGLPQPSPAAALALPAEETSSCAISSGWDIDDRALFLKS